MYLHWAVLHYSQRDWWLVNITGLPSDDVPALWTSVSLELCAFFHKSLPNCTIGKKNFIWIRLRMIFLALEHADSVFSVRILHDESIFLMPQLPTSYTQSGWSTQVALCSRGAEHLTRVPASTALQQINAKCLSQTVQGCWQIITRTVSEKCSGFEFVITLFSDWVLLPSSHLTPSWNLDGNCCTRSQASHSSYY